MWTRRRESGKVVGCRSGQSCESSSEKKLMLRAVLRASPGDELLLLIQGSNKAAACILLRAALRRGCATRRRKTAYRIHDRPPQLACLCYGKRPLTGLEKRGSIAIRAISDMPKLTEPSVPPKTQLTAGSQGVEARALRHHTCLCTRWRRALMLPLGGSVCVSGTAHSSSHTPAVASQRPVVAVGRTRVVTDRTIACSWRRAFFGIFGSLHSNLRPHAAAHAQSRSQ